MQMFLFIPDDECDQPVQIKRKDKIKVIVEQEKEVAATYGEYCKSIKLDKNLNIILNDNLREKLIELISAV